MHKHVVKYAALVAAGMLLSFGAQAAPSDQQKCGSAQGKAVAPLYASLFREAAKACAKGSAMSPEDVPFAPVARATGAFDTKVALNVDKYGFTDCPLDISDVTSADVWIQSTMLAVEACNP